MPDGAAVTGRAVLEETAGRAAALNGTVHTTSRGVKIANALQVARGYDHRVPDVVESPPRHTNRLAGETSPYLLQHAHNPVDWYPWGPEALTRAKLLDRPIFLSIGYAACHWCHVMERDAVVPALGRYALQALGDHRVERTNAVPEVEEVLVRQRAV